MIQETLQSIYDTSSSEVNNENSGLEIKKFKNLIEKKTTIDVQNLKQKCIFLIGNTKAGKSTLFHLLKGDELQVHNRYQLDVKDQSVESSIGHDCQSFTSNFSVFQNQELNFSIIDTPGLNETNDGFDEVINQIHLYNLLTQCKEVFILLVVYYDQRNDTDLQDTLKRAQELFLSNQNYKEDYLNNVFLILTETPYDQDQETMKQQLSARLSNILTKNNEFKAKETLQYFQQNSKKVVFFQKLASFQQQQELKLQIESLIMHSNGKDDSKSKKEYNYCIIISCKGKLMISEFLSKLQKFYEERFKLQYQEMIKQLKNLNDLRLEFAFCQQFYPIQKLPLHLHKVQIFQNKIKQIIQQFNLRIQLDEEIEKYSLFYEQKYIDHLLQVHIQQNKQEMINVNIEQNFQKFSEFAVQITKELQKQSQKESVKIKIKINQLLSLISEIDESDCESWDKLFLVVGNRLAGKSKALNLIFCKDQNVFIENYLDYQTLEKLQQESNSMVDTQYFNFADKDFQTIKQFQRNFVIEWREFSENQIPFTEFLLQVTAEKKKEFVIIMVVNYKYDQTTILNALGQFFKRNSYNQDWNLIVIDNTQVCKEQQLNVKIDEFIPLEVWNQRQSCQISQSNGILNVQNLEIFNSQFKIQVFEKKKEIEFCQWLETVIHPIFLSFQQKHFSSPLEIWQNQPLGQTIQLLLKLLLLKPEEPSFKTDVGKIYGQCKISEYNLYESNIQTLNQLYQMLIQSYNLTEKIDNCINHTNHIRYILEQLVQKLFKFDKSDLQQQIETLLIISQQFPSFFSQNSEGKKLLSGLKIVINKIFYEKKIYQGEVRDYCSLLKLTEIINYLKRVFFSIDSKNEFFHLVWDILQEVNRVTKCLIKLNSKVYYFLTKKHDISDYELNYYNQNPVIKIYQTLPNASPYINSQPFQNIYRDWRSGLIKALDFLQQTTPSTEEQADQIGSLKIAISSKIEQTEQIINKYLENEKKAQKIERNSKYFFFLRLENLKK